MVAFHTWATILAPPILFHVKPLQDPLPACALPRRGAVPSARRAYGRTCPPPPTPKHDEVAVWRRYSISLLSYTVRMRSWRFTAEIRGRWNTSSCDMRSKQAQTQDAAFDRSESRCCLGLIRTVLNQLVLVDRADAQAGASRQRPGGAGIGLLRFARANRPNSKMLRLCSIEHRIHPNPYGP